MSKNSIVLNYLKTTKNENAYQLSEEREIRPVTNYIHTGNYLLNAQISGSVYKGIPDGRIIQFSGPESVGKTYIATEVCINAQKQGYTPLYIDSEGDKELSSFEKRGIDPENFILSPMNSVKEIQTDILNILDKIGPDDKMLIIIDSFGNLATSKEIDDAKEGKEVRDMTGAQVRKSLFRTIAIPLSIKRVPLLLINHEYEVVGAYVPTKKQSGGTGSLYNSTGIFSFKKTKEKDGDSGVIGAIIKSKAVKNRLAKENTEIEFIINYNKGLLPYSGLFELACEAKIIDDSVKGWYTYKGDKMRRSQFAGNSSLWDEMLKEGLANYIENYFKYQSKIDDNSGDEEIEEALTDDEE